MTRSKTASETFGTLVTAFICKKAHGYLLAARLGEVRIIVSSWANVSAAYRIAAWISSLRLLPIYGVQNPIPEWYLDTISGREIGFIAIKIQFMAFIGHFHRWPAKSPQPKMSFRKRTLPLV